MTGRDTLRILKKNNFSRDRRRQVVEDMIFVLDEIKRIQNRIRDLDVNHLSKLLSMIIQTSVPASAAARKALQLERWGNLDERSRKTVLSNPTKKVTVYQSELMHYLQFGNGLKFQTKDPYLSQSDAARFTAFFCVVTGARSGDFVAYELKKSLDKIAVLEKKTETLSMTIQRNYRNWNTGQLPGLRPGVYSSWSNREGAEKYYTSSKEAVNKRRVKVTIQDINSKRVT